MTASKFDREGYYRDHKHYPKCGSDDICCTTMGMLFSSKDTNDAWCRCGWRGEVHDLIPEGKDK